VEKAGPFFFENGNPLGMRQLALEGNTLRWTNARGEAVLPFIPGETREISWPGCETEPALASAGWTEEKGLLRIRCFAVGDSPCGFDMLMLFRDGRVTVQSRRSHDPLTEGYQGVATGTEEGV